MALSILLLEQLYAGRYWRWRAFWCTETWGPQPAPKPLHYKLILDFVQSQELPPWQWLPQFWMHKLQREQEVVQPSVQVCKTKGTEVEAWKPVLIPQSQVIYNTKHRVRKTVFNAPCAM